MSFSCVRGERRQEKGKRNQDTFRESFSENFDEKLRCMSQEDGREKQDFLRQSFHVAQKMQLQTRVLFN